MNDKYNHILLIVLIALISTCPVIAQNVQKKKTRVQVEYFKDHNGSESIVATLKIKEDSYVPYEDAEIHFYSINDTSKILLDKIRTDKDGEALYLMEDHLKNYKDSSGLMTFEVEYKGNSSTRGSNRDIKVHQVNLKVSFVQEDSVKYIAVEAKEIATDNTTLPIEEHEILLYIKGTFSLLNIGQEVTDEEGKIIVEFPVEMPGDSVGVLTIVAKIEESDTYGNVEAQGVVNWGKPVPLKVKEHRGLGDTDAPLWMVYTLIILLSAVWFHYLYVIFLIVKIKLARSSFNS